MAKVIYNTATSLNGYIADENNSLDWLFKVDDATAPDHLAFLEGIDVVVSGSTTFEWVVEQEDLINHPEKWPTYFGQRPMYVFTSRELSIPEGANVHLVNGSVAEHFETIEGDTQGGNIWIVGGGDLAGQFYDCGHLDEIQLSFTPVALLGGSPVLPRTIGPETLELTAIERFGQFAHMTFSVKK
jgi:dihydrofolate reductase